MKILNILGIVLGSSVISVLITSLFTRSSHAETIALKYITEERAKWREKIKKLMTELCFFINESPIDMAKVRGTSTCFKLCLNPNKNEIIDSQIIKTIDSLCELPTYEKLNKLEEQVSLLLKHDWERAKNEAKGTFSLVLILPTFIFILWFVFYMFINNIWIFEYIKNIPNVSGSYSELAVLFIMIITPFSVLKLFYNKKSYFIKKEYNNKFINEFQLQNKIDETKHWVFFTLISSVRDKIVKLMFNKGKTMTLIDNIRLEIKSGKIPPIFTPFDFKSIGIEDKNNNISNYDKKNKGPQNTHTTVLVSIEIGNETYYTFDEKLFD